MSDLKYKNRIDKVKEIIVATGVVDQMETSNLAFYATMKHKNAKRLGGGLVTENFSELIHVVENLMIFENLCEYAKKDIKNIIDGFDFNDDLSLNMFYAFKDTMKNSQASSNTDNSENTCSKLFEMFEKFSEEEEKNGKE